MAEPLQLPAIKLFNTLTRSVDTLKPLQPGTVSVYCCGPTVYNYQHIGNLRTYIFEDLLIRTLKYACYQVKHVMNITDVGHLVSDADEGEDKMAVAAKREKKSSKELAEYYTEIFFNHCDLLNVKRPDIICKATEHIAEMIALVERLEQRGYAYQSGGNVYFDVEKCKDYGKLARLDLEGLVAGARIEVDSKKKNPLDFALWFTKSKFEDQELQWDSPWGKGYPGWHIECSAMSMKYLGESFDIHCGGIDHIPVHHTNEIAQSECGTGKPFAEVWMHGAFLVSRKEKMSKSSGDFLTLDRLVERGFDPMSYRLMCLGASYRSELIFSWEAVEGAANSLRKLKLATQKLHAAVGNNFEPSALSNAGLKYKAEFQESVFNDLAMPKALATVHSIINDTTLSEAEKLSLLLDFDKVLGLGFASWQEQKIEIPAEVNELVNKRQAARAARNWEESDMIREQINALGFSVEDSKNGPVIKPL